MPSPGSYQSPSPQDASSAEHGGPATIANLDPCERASGWRLITRSSLVAVVAASVSAGCGSDGRIDGRVVGPSPQSGVIAPCDPRLIDAWRFEVEAGDEVFVAVDTTSPLTAADMEIRGICGDSDTFFGDDDYLCSFPPPQFSCPVATLEASERATCTVDVSPALAALDPPTASCTNAQRAEYSLTVQVNGESAILVLVREGVDQTCVGGSRNGRSCDSDRNCPGGACISDTDPGMWSYRPKLP